MPCCITLCLTKKSSPKQTTWSQISSSSPVHTGNISNLSPVAILKDVIWPSQPVRYDRYESAIYQAAGPKWSKFIERILLRTDKLPFQGNHEKFQLDPAVSSKLLLFLPGFN